MTCPPARQWPGRSQSVRWTFRSFGAKLSESDSWLKRFPFVLAVFSRCMKKAPTSRPVVARVHPRGEPHESYPRHETAGRYHTLLVASGAHVHFVIHELFFVKDRSFVQALIFPGSHVRKVLIIPLGFTLGSLKFFAEMSTAGFLSVQRIRAEQFGELHEIRNAPSIFQRLVQAAVLSGYVDVFPEFLAEFGDALKRFLQPSLVARHSALFPKQLA